ncbi:MAG: acyl-CoA dehydrogenase family protein [Ktedonobacteraceae bacterium]|nr:acyl-CoA dehydrogenase family protein [Ktedonobacteraceae bacterium]
MLDFSPTEEQEEIRHLARSIAIEQLRTQGRSSEKNGDISPSLMQILTQTGLITPFPEKYGGSGPIEAITYALIAEEFGFGDGALSMNCIGSLIGPLTVALVGTPEQQERYIPPFCATSGDYAQRGSLAFAERTGGYSLEDISATASRDGNNYILNGTKRNVIHGSQSNPRIALFRLAGREGLSDLCAFVLPDHLDGLQITPDTEKLGLISAPSASYTFTNAVVPASSLLGEPGHSGAIRAATLYMILRAAIACGMARAALEYASAYAKERIAFGRPIASYQGIAFILAEMAMNLDAVRLLLWTAAVNWDNDGDSGTLLRDSEAAQRQALTIGKSATIDAIQVLGGAGFMQDHPAEMWMRNAAAME